MHLVPATIQISQFAYSFLLKRVGIVAKGNLQVVCRNFLSSILLRLLTFSLPDIAYFMSRCTKDGAYHYSNPTARERSNCLTIIRAVGRLEFLLDTPGNCPVHFKLRPATLKFKLFFFFLWNLHFKLFFLLIFLLLKLEMKMQIRNQLNTIADLHFGSTVHQYP